MLLLHSCWHCMSLTTADGVGVLQVRSLSSICTLSTRVLDLKGIHLFTCNGMQQHCTVCNRAQAALAAAVMQCTKSHCAHPI